ncbi:MAG: hypothetical protein ACKO0Z_25000 [Betaproteobacteria bacterium]
MTKVKSRMPKDPAPLRSPTVFERQLKRLAYWGLLYVAGLFWLALLAALFLN